MTKKTTSIELKSVPIQHFQMEMKSHVRLPDGKTVRFKGYASTPDLDRSYDIVLPSGFQASLEHYKSTGTAPALLRSHNPDRPVGKILMEGEDAPVITDKGVLITADVTEEETGRQVENGEMVTLSIGFIPRSIDYELRGTGRIEAQSGQELLVEARIIKELDWVETSIVSTPDNPRAILTVAKSISKFFNSYPSHIMKHTCDFCPSESKSVAFGKVGDKHVCEKCAGSMEFKGDVKLEKFEAKENEEAKPEEKVEEKVEEKKEEEKVDEKPKESPNTPTDATPGEKPEAEAKPEEGKPEGGNEGEEVEKHVISVEHKDALKQLIQKLTLVDAHTTTDEEIEQKSLALTKAIENGEVKAIDVMLPVLTKMAEMIAVLRKDNTEMKAAMSKVALPKGKTIQAFQHSIIVNGDEAAKTDEQKSTEQKDVGFLSFIKSSKNGAQSVGDDA